MTLTAQEAGTIRHTKRAGAVLEAGCILAKLDLDDPSKVHKPVLFTKGIIKQNNSII